MFYVSLMVTSRQKTITDTQKRKRKKSKYNTKEKSLNHKGRNKGTTKQPENNYKMAIVSPYLSIIALNVNGLNSPIKRHRVAKWI